MKSRRTFKGNPNFGTRPISERVNNIAKDIAVKLHSDKYLTVDANHWGLRFAYGISMEDRVIANKALNKINTMKLLVKPNELKITQN